jgi:hypothetical protein
MISREAKPGEEPKPLEKVASGGELSRIALALKTCLAATGAGRTLVFDEVDTGGLPRRRGHRQNYRETLARLATPAARVIMMVRPHCGKDSFRPCGASLLKWLKTLL